jgi:hypothetical protein
MQDQKGVNELAIELDIAPSTVSIKRRKGKTDEEIRQEADLTKARGLTKPNGATSWPWPKSMSFS